MTSILVVEMAEEVAAVAADRLVVNTTNLGAYSGRTGRISAVIGRINTLQSRICTLYQTDDVSGLYYFYRYNRFYAGTQTLERCQNYIANTVADLEIVERYFSTVDPLRFEGVSTSLIQIVQSSDRTTHKKVLECVVERFCGKCAAIKDFKSLLLLLTGAQAYSGGRVSPRDDTEEADLVQKVLKYCEKALTGVDKFTENDKAGLLGSIVGYVASMYTCATDQYENGCDIVAGIGTGVNQTTGLIKSIYAYREKKVAADAAKSMYDKRGKAISRLDILGDVVGLVGDAVQTIDNSFDNERKWYENLADLTDIYADGIDIIGDVYMLEYLGEKAVNIVSPPGTKNQILATKKLEYVDKTARNKAVIGLNFVSMIMKGVENTTYYIGQYSEDGTMNFQDWTNAVISFSCGALAEDISILTGGIVNLDAKDMTDLVTEDWYSACDSFIRQDPRLSLYLHNEDEPYFERLACAIGVECVVAGKAIYDWTDTQLDALDAKGVAALENWQNAAADYINSSENLSAYMSYDGNTWSNNVISRTMVGIGSSTIVAAEATYNWVDTQMNKFDQWVLGLFK